MLRAKLTRVAKQLISLSTTNKGCSNSFNSDTILVNEASANFSYSLLNNCIPIDVVFQDLSINPVNWEWELDNIWTSVLSNPSQQFSNFPTDSIKLTITDINGCKDSISKQIVNNFNAEFMVSDTLTCSGTTLTFNPISEVVNTWIWDFGDGNTSTDSVPSHSYQNPGLYNIQLIASDGQGCTDTKVSSILSNTRKNLTNCTTGILSNNGCNQILPSSLIPNTANILSNCASGKLISSGCQDIKVSGILSNTGKDLANCTSGILTGQGCKQNTIPSVIDKRNFGSIDIEQICPAFVKKYIEGPRNELRSSGIISGCEVTLVSLSTDSLGNYVEVNISPGVCITSGIRREFLGVLGFRARIGGPSYFCINEFGCFEAAKEISGTTTMVNVSPFIGRGVVHLAGTY